MPQLLLKYGLDKLSPDEKQDLLEVLEDHVERELEFQPLTSEDQAMLGERRARIAADRAAGIDRSVYGSGECK